VNNVGFVLYKLGRVAEAAVALEKTVAIDPMRGPAYVNLGDAYEKLGRAARKAYSKYLELMPTSPLAGKIRAKVGPR
jgi:tetratricopeptide (TPR) repeat protein